MDAAERAAEVFVRRYEALNEEYLKIIGERIRAIGRVSPTDLYRLERLRDIGTDMDALKRKLASETGKSLKELEKLLRQAADAAMKPYDGLMNAEPYLRNEIAEAMAAAQYIETARAMVNLSNTTVSSAAYQGLVDRAVSAVQLGTESYQSAIRSVLRSTAWDGLCVVDGTRKVRYASGLTRRLDTAARQNVLDGFRALMQRTRDETGKAFGADGVEISAHMLCAEDHLPYQGRQFSLEEFERLNQTLRRPIAKGYGIAAMWPSRLYWASANRRTRRRSWPSTAAVAWSRSPLTERPKAATSGRRSSGGLKPPSAGKRTLPLPQKPPGTTCCAGSASRG